MGSKAVLETSRTRLRQFTRRDLDVVAAMVEDEEQMHFYPRPRSRDEASAWIDRNLSLYQEHGYGMWLIESKATTEFLGYCGVRPIRVEGSDETEIGWHTRKRFWGQGFATEAARGCRDLAFSRLGAERLIALIDPTNVASVRVAEKIGMRPEREAVVDDYACVIYAVESGPRL
jgi:[ribosomal protein S5]-alanine N-acetyltransferase